MYLPNGQGMVIMRQTPPSPHRHQPNTQGIQQMQEWRRGVMMPGIEAGQPQWGEVPDVGSCLLPGEVTNRLGEFAWALKETSVVSPIYPFQNSRLTRRQTGDFATWKALVRRYFAVGALTYYTLTHQGNQTTKTFGTFR
jgi:hypothetical protein